MLLLDFYRGKKIFITGVTGFKGSWLCQILLDAGAEVIGYSLESPTSPSLFSQLNLESKIIYFKEDVRDLSALKSALVKSQPEIVFHLAAQPLVLESYKDPVGTYEVNVMGTVNLFQAILGIDSIKSVINITTDKVYENKEWFWGYREDENLCGHDPYSNSKSCSELVTYSYRNSFFNKPNSPAISTARSGNVIGGGDYSDFRVIPDCVRAANSNQKIVVRNPNSIRPYQHVLECLYGYLLLATKQHADNNLSGAYNFGPNDESCITTGQLVDLFCFFWGNDISWESKNIDNPHEANFLSLDHSKAKSLIGWQPKINIKESVEKVIEFAKLNTDEDRRAIVKKQIKEYFKEIKI